MVVCRKDLFVPSAKIMKAITHLHGPMPQKDMTFISSFPGSWQLYGGKKTDPYFSTYMVHQSLSKVDYVYAKDLCTGLMHSISSCPFGPLESKLAISLVTYFMKTHEEKLSCFDLVPFDRQMHSRVIQAISNLNTLDEAEKVALPQLPFRFDDIAETTQLFVAILLANPASPLVTETEANELRNCTLEIGELLQEFDRKVPIKNNGSVYADVAMWVSSVVTIFGRFIKDNSELMASKEIENFKVPVRLFQMRNEKITMARELLHKLKSNGMDVSGFEDEINAMPELSILPFRQVFEIVPRESIKKIDFVTITLSYEDAPIPLLNGGYGDLWGGEMIPYIFEDAGDEPIQECKEGQTSTDLVTTSDSEVEEKPKKKKKVKTAKRKSEELVKSEKKESESCPKCYRASLHTQKAYEKLRVDKIETKSLKKKLTEMEMENLKKDEKIRDLMMLVESQKKELKQKDEVIRNQKEQMEENQKIVETMQMQLEHKTELVEDLEAAISLAPVPGNLPEESTPNRSQEQTETVREVLFTLLNAQSILKVEKPIQKVLHMTNKLMAKSKNADVHKRARFETIKYRQACTKYSEAVESNLAMIRANQLITVDQIPELPAFPTLSLWFQDAYKETMKSDVPIICESLTSEVNPDELADKECLICLDHMVSEDDTTKCECCKRRYHKECIQEWFQTKRSCPTCSSGLLDDQEFPALS